MVQEYKEALVSVEEESNDDKRKKWMLWGGISAAAVLILLLCGYFFWYVPYATDRDAPRSYVLANNLFMRSTKMAGVEHNIITKIPYGSELITYSNDGEWADVKVNGQRGFVSSAFIIDKDDFDLLHNLWGTLDAKDCIESSKCRQALIHYCKYNNLTTGADGWQHYTLQKDAKSNYVLYPRLDNGYSKFTEFAFILKNNQTGEHRFAIYSFNKETERPVFLFDENVSGRGLLSSITYDPRRQHYDILFADDPEDSGCAGYYDSGYDPNVDYE